MTAGSNPLCDVWGFLAISDRRQHPRDKVLEHADKERRTENASSVVNIRTSPVVFDRKRDNRTLYAVDVTGGGRSSAINRRMSAKRFFGMATSAIWNAT
jgi:hypothetical protein